MSFKNVVQHNAGEGVSDIQATQLGLSTQRTGVVKDATGRQKKYTCQITHFADLPNVAPDVPEQADK